MELSIFHYIGAICRFVMSLFSNPVTGSGLEGDAVRTDGESEGVAISRDKAGEGLVQGNAVTALFGVAVGKAEGIVKYHPAGLVCLVGDEERFNQIGGGGLERATVGAAQTELWCQGGPFFNGCLFGVAGYGGVGKFLREVAFCRQFADRDAVGGDVIEVGAVKHIGAYPDADVQFGEDVLHGELHVHTGCAGGGLSVAVYHPVGIGCAPEEFLYRVGGRLLQVVSVQGNVLD